MAGPNPQYVIDTDALIHIGDMDDSDRVFGEIIAHVEAGTIKTVEQVFDELERWPDVHQRFKPHKKTMLIADQYSNQAIFDEAGYISENFELINEFYGQILIRLTLGS